MKILIAEDDSSVRKGLLYTLKEAGYQVLEATNGSEALELLKKERVSLVISDIRMPKIDGMELLKRAKELYPDTVFMIITAHGTVDLAVDAMKLGAADFIMKPFSLDEIEEKVQRAVMVAPAEAVLDGDAVFESPVMKDIIDMAVQVAPTDSSILITGQSGTGKEVLADIIQKNSLRKTKPFVKVNCAALSDSILESELFGHVKGAFTGANADRIGRFEAADGGTIFLDEIGDISGKMQAQLLRLLQFGEYEKVGSVEKRTVDVRVIAATNKNLTEEIEKGNFREDLYYRLNVIEIELPPLAERCDDILPLAHMFLKASSEKYNKKIAGIDDAARELLTSYHWPGNVRELRNCIERACILCRNSQITAKEIKIHSRSVKPESTSGNLSETLENKEKNLILQAFEQESGNRTRMAKRLGINRTALLYKIKKYGIGE